MIKYDGVEVEVINETVRDVEVRVIAKAPWDDSPDVGEVFWMNKDDPYFEGLNNE